MTDQTPDTCASYGCPMLGVYGDSGKWICACHFNVNPAVSDAITAELHRQKPLVDRILNLRRLGEADPKIEGELVDIIREIGQQRPIEPHFSEVDA